MSKADDGNIPKWLRIALTLLQVHFHLDSLFNGGNYIAVGTK